MEHITSSILRDMPVVFIWVNHPNEQRRNKLYSAYFAEDPFQSVTTDTTPCWMRKAQ